jgi:hypothetical protein
LWFNLAVINSTNCRFLIRANSDDLTITAGLWLNPTTMFKTSLPVCGSTWQQWSRHHCRLVAQPGSDTISNTAGSVLAGNVICFLHFALYNLFYIFWYNRYSPFILLMKHYKNDYKH